MVLIKTTWECFREEQCQRWKELVLISEEALVELDNVQRAVCSETETKTETGSDCDQKNVEASPKKHNRALNCLRDFNNTATNDIHLSKRTRRDRAKNTFLRF